MSNQIVTEKMQMMLETVKEQAKKAEKEYDERERVIQRKSSSSINLYGYDTTNRVVELASLAREACDSLYATYQMLIKMLDEQCRPLLEEEPDVIIVGEISKYIKWLNDESEIENNFSASYNSMNLGNVATAKYIPSIENKMIQKYWETKYDMWPGRAEAEKKLREERLEAQRAKENEKKERAEKEKREYAEAYSAWKKESDPIFKLREEELEKCLVKEKEELENKIKMSRDADINAKTAMREDCIRKKETAEATLASLGMFKFAEKKENKNIIQEMTALISKIEAEIEAVEKNYQREMNFVKSKMGARKPQIEKELREKYPIPAEPKKPMSVRLGSNPTAIQIANEYLKDEILETLDIYGKLSILDIMEKCPAVMDLSNQRVSALVRQLVDSRQVVRTEQERKAYFEVAR